MTWPTTRILPPGRIVALALIAILIAGLTFIRLASGTELLSVPADAQAGDLTLEPCTFMTEGGPYRADCGTLIVAEDARRPASPLLALPVTRIRAMSDDPGEPIFRLEGGPGQTNMDFEAASRLVDDHDLVLVGYRGIDGSVRLDCPEVEAALDGSTDLLGEATFRTYAAAHGDCADRLSDEGVDLTRYGLVQQVDDMEVARTALGYDRINLLSESAGTRTAMIYAWRYPDSIHRSVMVGVNPPGNFLWDPVIVDEQIDRFAARCAQDPNCSRRTDDLAATMRRLTADVPERWLFVPIDGGYARVLSFVGLMQSTTVFPPGREVTLEALLAASEGDPSGLWLISLVGDIMYPKLFVWGQYAAAATIDAEAGREYFSSRTRDLSNMGYAATAAAWGGGQWIDRWPATAEDAAYRQVRASPVPTLLIGGELDVSTPPQVASQQLLPSLSNGHEVVLSGFGHSPSFWAEQPEAGTRLISTFFDRGQVDLSLYRPQILDFTPSMTLGQIAKIVLGVMVALAMLALGSLAWMARHVRTRGGFGHAGIALRSVFPILLGLGGWCFAVLLTLTVRLPVALDSELLTVFAEGIPIGAGIFLAWTHRDRPADSRQRGIVLAAVGALVGAALGFNAATVAFGGLLFAIVGAIAGANLLLIVLDIVTTWTARRRYGPPARIDLAREHVGASGAPKGGHSIRPLRRPHATTYNRC